MNYARGQLNAQAWRLSNAVLKNGAATDTMIDDALWLYQNALYGAFVTNATMATDAQLDYRIEKLLRELELRQSIDHAAFCPLGYNGSWRQMIDRIGPSPISEGMAELRKMIGKYIKGAEWCGECRDFKPCGCGESQ